MKIKPPIFLHPLMPVILNVLVYFSSYFIYDFTKNVPDHIWYIYISVLLISFAFSLVFFDFTGFSLSFRRLPLIKLLICIVCFAAVFEYMVMGVPLLGQIVYADFGLPLIHHIAVFSWVIIFGLDRFKSKSVRFLLFFFFFANPILMINRDLLFITFFMMIFYLWGKNKINYKKVFIAFILVLLLFGLLGQIRSPHALKAITLPFSFDLDTVPPIVVWLVLYITSSSFNFYNNVSGLTMELYSVFINVFPEPYGWSSKLSSLYFFTLYYIFSLFILFSLRTLASARVNSYWVIMYVYLIYQSYMSIFSTKFFTTNTIFVFLVFILVSVISFLGKKVL